MIYVGIDIAKLNHYAAALSSDGIVLTEPFKFSNDADGFQMLSSELSDFAPESIFIGLESTAHYGDNLVRYLVANDYKVCVLNPIQTSSKVYEASGKVKNPSLPLMWTRCSRNCSIISNPVCIKNLSMRYLKKHLHRRTLLPCI